MTGIASRDWRGKYKWSPLRKIDSPPYHRPQFHLKYAMTREEEEGKGGRDGESGGEGKLHYKEQRA